MGAITDRLPDCASAVGMVPTSGGRRPFLIHHSKYSALNQTSASLPQSKPFRRTLSCGTTCSPQPPAQGTAGIGGGRGGQGGGGGRPRLGGRGGSIRTSGRGARTVA